MPAHRRRTVESYSEVDYYAGILDNTPDLVTTKFQSRNNARRKQPDSVELNRGLGQRGDGIDLNSVSDPVFPTHKDNLSLLNTKPLHQPGSSSSHTPAATGFLTRLPPASPTLVKARAMERVSGYPMSNRPSNNIVEEYLSPINDAYTGDFQDFKRLTDADKQEVIMREAEDYGLEKPQGWNVSFHYNPHVEYHHFGSSHPMKPWRLTLTKQLVLSYGLEYTMDLYEPRPASYKELAIFHDREYLSYLSE